jgi:hypothetical protein
MATVLVTRIELLYCPGLDYFHKYLQSVSDSMMMMMMMMMILMLLKAMGY